MKTHHLDRRIESDYIDNSDEHYSYDDLDNRLTLNTRSDQDVAYSHNTANEYTSIGGQSVSHDEAGNLVMDQRGYQYDHVGNLDKKTVTYDGANYEESFAYDGLGRMLEAVKYRGATHIATSEFEYNSFSKVTEATETILDADAVEIGYDYDQLGNLTGITYPDANDVTISREALGRIDTISIDGDTIASYKYIGSKVKRRSYNSPSVTYDIDYNGLGLATRHHTYTTGTNIADFEYEYDDNGNITKQEFNHRPSTPYNDYDYDDLDHLTEADYLVGVLTEDEQFTYDDLGNRTNVNLRSGDDESYSVDNLTNRYNSVGGNSLDYDDAGNLTQDPNGYEYEYDYENRLIEVTKGETAIAQYEYDALGRRIQRIDSVANETTRYYYDNEWRVLAEYDDNDTQLRDFIYGNYIDEVLVMADSSEDAYYYAHNHIYSSVALIDEDGNVVERYEYNAYGSPTIYNSDFSQTYDASQYGNPYMFTGRHMDSLDSNNLRLGYNRIRYFDYYTGRWLSHDPLGIMPNAIKPNVFRIRNQYKDGLNIYQYVASKPILKYDSYGLNATSPKPEQETSPYTCCKIQEKYGVTHSHYEVVVTVSTSGYPVYSKRKKTTTSTVDTYKQETIDKQSDKNPMKVCKCHYQNNPHIIAVYGAHEGKCRWCDVYLMSEPLPILGHYYIVVECPSFRYSVESFPDVSGQGIIDWKEYELKMNLYGVFPGPNWQMGDCRISEDAARMWYMQFKGTKYGFNIFVENCFDFAYSIFHYMCKTKP